MTPHTLIVGAGPYGISLGVALHHAGLPFTIVGKPFSLWLDHTIDSMALRSDYQSSELYSPRGELGYARFCRETTPDRGGLRDSVRGRIPVPLFRKYLLWIRDRLPFPVLEDMVSDLRRKSEGFVARTGGGAHIQASRVVLATGIEAHRHVPAELSHLPPDRVIHSYFVGDYRPLRGERILVVGGGQSAAEAIDLLATNNEIVWHHRSPLRFYSEPLDLPRPLFKLILRTPAILRLLPRSWVARWLRRFTQVTITPEYRERLAPIPKATAADVAALRVEDGALVDGSGRRHDRVLSCTGYRYDLGRLKFLAPELRDEIRCDGTWPAVDGRFRTSAPGLYIIGGMAEPVFGPALRFMIGCKYTAQSLSSTFAAAA